MKTNKHIAGIILAGGKSSRMGSDKGFVLYKNKAFIQHIIEAISPLVDDLIIVSNNSAYDIFTLHSPMGLEYTIKRVDDLIEYAGPLAGVYTGLYYSNIEHNLVVSCDVPLINSKTLSILIENIDTKTDIVQFESQGKTMPLIAIYKKHCLETFGSLLKEGERRLRVALKHLNVKTITLDKKQEKFTKNINTPIDLSEVEKIV